MNKKSWIITFVTLGLVLLWGFTLWQAKSKKNTQPPEQAVHIGAILPLSGKASQYGIWIQEALELARDEINQTGGINGVPLKIIFEDDQANPKLASNAMKKLVSSDHVSVVFGSWASSSVLAQAPIANESKVVIMGEAVSPKIRDAGDFVFRIQPDGSVYLKELIPFMVKNLEFKTASIMYVKNDFGVDLADTAESLLQNAGKNVLAKQAFTQGETNFRTQLTVSRASAPDVIFVFAYAEAGHILKQARELGIKAPFFAAATFENPNILKIAGNAAEGVIYPHHFDPASNDPTIEAFQKKYIQRYGRPSEGFAVLAYDGLFILSNALRQCGGEDGVCIRDFLYNMKPYEGITGTTIFDDHGDVLKNIMIKTVKDGKFVPYIERQQKGN